MDSFAPWAQCGFDETTRHRIRIPKKLLSSIGREPSGISFIEGAELQNLRIFFSLREFSGLSRIVLVPIASSGEAIGFFLFAERISEQSEAGFPYEPFGEAIGAFAPAFSESRALIERQGRHDTREEPAEALEDFLEAARAKGMKASLLVVSLKALLDSMKAGNPLADVFRIYQDSFALVSGIVSAAGKAVRLPGQRIAVIFASLRQPDCELLVFQMRKSLKNLFGSAKDLPITPELMLELPEHPDIPALLSLKD